MGRFQIYYHSDNRTAAKLLLLITREKGDPPRPAKPTSPEALGPHDPGSQRSVVWSRQVIDPEKGPYALKDRDFERRTERRGFEPRVRAYTRTTV